MRPGMIPVIRIQPPEDFPGGPLKPLVDGMTLPTVRLAHPVGQVLFVLPDDLHRLVRAPAVDDDVLKVPRFGYPSSMTDRMVLSRYFPRLKEGVTMEILGKKIMNLPPVRKGTCQGHC